jgi:hypothetical protein
MEGRATAEQVATLLLENRQVAVKEKPKVFSRPSYGSTHCGVVAPAGIIQTQVAPGVQYSSQKLGC